MGSSVVNSFICYIDGTLKGNKIGRCGPRSNGNEGIHNIPQSSMIEVSPYNAVQYHIQDACWERSNPLP